MLLLVISLSSVVQEGSNAMFMLSASTVCEVLLGLSAVSCWQLMNIWNEQPNQGLWFSTRLQNTIFNALSYQGMVLGIFGLFFAAVAWCDLSESELADILMKAHKADQKIPVLSTQKPNLDVQTAYRVQKVYVDQRLAQDQIAGFKAGFCTEAAQKKYGLTDPAAGVLFASGKKMGFPLIEKSAFKNLIVETEFGFLMGKSITQPLKDISELYEYIQAVMPVIELPDAGFAEKASGVDIIAANVASAKFIAGKEREFNGLDLNNIFVNLYFEGQEVNKGKGVECPRSFIPNGILRISIIAG